MLKMKQSFMIHPVGEKCLNKSNSEKRSNDTHFVLLQKNTFYADNPVLLLKARVKNLVLYNSLIAINDNIEHF